MSEILCEDIKGKIKSVLKIPDCATFWEVTSDNDSLRVCWEVIDKKREAGFNKE